MSQTELLSVGTAGATPVFSLRYNTANSIIAQSFKIPSYDVLLKSIKLRLKKVGSPTGDYWCEIHSSRAGTSATIDSSTNIVGQATATKDIASTLSTSFAWKEFTFAAADRPKLLGGETYYLVVYADSTISTSNYIAGDNNAGNVYGNGTAWKIDDSQVWTDAAPYDISFILYGAYLFTESVVVQDTTSATVSLSDTFVEQIEITDDASSSQSIQTDFAYYLLTNDGKVHEYGPDFKTDDDSPITKRYVSKNTDFTDQASPSDIFKTVYSVKAFYRDLDENTQVTLSISLDDGDTWETSPTGTKSLGTGSGKTRTATWNFPGGKMGQFFKFKLESGSSSTRVQWLGLEVEYGEDGPHFNIN